VVATRYAFRDDRMDLRFLVLGAVLPDLIDTPLGLFGFSTFGAVRLFSHSLLFGALVMTGVVLGTRRGRPRKRWMPVAIGILMHLFLDAMWADPETLWWPFLGWDFATSGFADAAALIAAVVSDWRVWALEALGAVYLAYLARRGNLASRPQRDRFLKTGRIGVPIDRR
jgi:membrane-bound metal-dependent hydrolase YbcI (DUF457 family)